MTAVKEGPVAVAEVPAAVAAPDAPAVVGAEPDQTDLAHVPLGVQLPADPISEVWEDDG